MRTIVLNSTDIVNTSGGLNSTFAFTFPPGLGKFKGAKVALVGLSTYYSEFNITAANNNNRFSYAWVDGTSHTAVIPDGFYIVDDLQTYFQFVMKQNTHYLMDNVGNLVFLFLLSTDPTQYSVMLNCFGIDTSVATAQKWTLPSGASWAIPTTYIVPIFTVLSNAFASVIGFASSNYPNATITYTAPFTRSESPLCSSTQSFTSSVAPQVSPTSSYNILCNIANNKYNLQSTFIYNYLVQAGTGFGGGYNIAPPQLIWIPVQDKEQQSCTVRITDQNFKPVSWQDTDTSITLAILTDEELLELQGNTAGVMSYIGKSVM